MGETILVLRPLLPVGLDLLRSRPNTEVVLIEVPTPDDIRAALPRADAVVLRNTVLTPDMIDAAERLRVVSKHGVGLDNVPLDLLTARGIVAAITGEANSGSVAEHTLMLMLALSRRLPQYDRRARAGGFITDPAWPTHDLAGRTLAIVGAGRIGQRVARLALAFGMAVIMHDPFADEATVRATGAEPEADLRTALGRADIVSLHCPLTDGTGHLMDEAAFAAMRPGAFLINTGRGELVDEAALLDAVRSGRLAGAGLDVFAVEPPDPNNPLFTEERIIVSPHTAALTEEAAWRMSRISAQNAILGLKGRLPREHVGNPAVLERLA